ncbi:Hydrolase [Sinomonas atrocyanea]|uniref:Hydrolase n=1 Tax=Sinomonas atrocyanea TaxID=37927 RepID=A0A126ZUL7_9MICC|nr:amidohydrolase [Sinomonas atrocyanea]AMM30783.1 Hydrolase [Sinomonas atrocyanea]GEB63829.1 amidohydrolase [Sinomonas atrocyanea]GGG65161.1 amidohydrolase [Sinomonas atrocyanea]
MSHATIYHNGHIYTADAGGTWAEAILVEGGRIAAIGRKEDVQAAAPDGCEAVDLEGRMVMPGIHDAHIHLLFSGLKFRYEARLTPMADGEQVVKDLTECCQGHTLPELPDGWIIGGEINPLAFPDSRPDRQFLDHAFPDRPVFLYDYSIHHAVVNSKALELAGIDAGTPDPEGGRFVRRSDGAELTGELVEHGTWPVQRVVPDYPPEVYRDAVAWATHVCNGVGITSVQEASAGWQELRALKELDETADLSLHVAAHIVWREEGFGMAPLADLERLIDERATYSSRHVRTDFVKLWLDGAPLPPHFTEAGMTDGEVDQHKILVPNDELLAALLRFDREGLQIKIHCAGTGSVRVALDAFSEVRRINGPDGPAHEIAHCTYIQDEDYERFRQLRVTAEMSPAIWHIPEFDAVLSEGYRFASLQKSGAPMTVGSDWIITSDPNLFPALQGMVQRQGEAVDLDYALRAMTIEGARAIGRESEQGSLEPGKSADFIVLDRNLFQIPTDEIGGTRVLRTVFEGRTVFTDGAAKSS